MSGERRLLEVLRADADAGEVRWIVDRIDQGLAEIDERAARHEAVLSEFRELAREAVGKANRPDLGIADFVTGYAAMFLIDLVEGRWEPRRHDPELAALPDPEHRRSER